MSLKPLKPSKQKKKDKKHKKQLYRVTVMVRPAGSTHPHPRRPLSSCNTDGGGQDNGCGMPHADIPRMLGRVLSGSKYQLRQARGRSS